MADRTPLQVDEKWLSFRAEPELAARFQAWKNRFAEKASARKTATDFAMAYLLNLALTAEGFPPSDRPLSSAALERTVLADELGATDTNDPRR